MLLKNAIIYNDEFEPVAQNITVEGERIVALDNREDGDTVLDLAGYTVLPGLIDIHIHGCGGHDTGEATEEALQAMSTCLVSRGVTSFCPTSMTLPFEELQRIFRNVADCCQKVNGAYIQGINMEGPYIAMSKKGAQNGAYVRNPDKEEFKRLQADCGGLVKLVDIAPECDGSKEFIEEIQPLCTVSIAHTNANYDEACQAIEWGARHVTHLYNAQNGLTHRNPGVVGAVFDKTREYGVRAEMICDGFHIHPAALRIAFAQLGEDNSIIISDSMCAAGHADGEYDLGGQTVYVKGGIALLADGTIAASTSNVYEELRNVLRFGIPKKQAIKSATINPARAIRVDHETGSIKEGKLADLLVVDDDFNIVMVIVRGKIKVDNR